MPDIECESKALRKEKLAGENVFGLCVCNRFREFAESKIVVLGFCSEEKCGSKYGIRGISHERIGSIESFDVLNRGRLQNW